MKNQTILILDFGTSNVRSVLVSAESGDVVGSASIKNKWIQTEEGYYEMNAERIWRSSVKTVGAVISEHPEVEIKGIGFSFLGDALIPVDENLKPLRGMIMAFDTRAQAEAEQIRTSIGAEEFKSIIGGPCLSMLVCSKLLWIRKHEPEIFKKTKYFLHIQEYILAKLGLGITTDYTMATRKTMLDIRTKKWSEELMKLTDVSRERLGTDIHDSTFVAGRIKKFGDVALPNEVPVVIGAHDSECGVLGLGVNPERNDIIGNVSGTYEMMGFFTDSDVDNSKFPLVERGCALSQNSMIINGSSIAGSYVKWYQNNICKYPKKMFEHIEDLLCYDGNGNIFFLADNDRQGCMLSGFDQFTKQEMIYQAIMEGITFKLRRLKDEMEAATGKGFGVMLAGGGGASSYKWLQFKADLFKIPVRRVRNKEASAVGAAIITAVGTGIFKNYTEAIGVMTGTEREFLPNAEISDKYQKKYERYLQLMNML